MDWGLGLVANNPLTKGLVNGAQALGQGLGDAAHQVAQGLGWTLPPDKWAAYPAYMQHAPGDPENDPNYYPRTYARAVLGNYDPKTLPKQIPNLAVYRADPTGKFGGTDGLETQPTRFNVDQNTSVSGGGSPVDMYAYARELARAGKYGVPQLSAQQLAAMALKEGRPNYGANGADIKNPANLALAKKLYPNETFSHGYDLFGQKDFPVLVAEKMATAKRLGIPFEMAWNGAGRAPTGGTGADYAAAFPAYMKAAANPKNAQLVSFIQSALDAGKNDR